MPFSFQLHYFPTAKVNAAITESHLIAVVGRNLWESSNPIVPLRVESAIRGHSRKWKFSKPVRFRYLQELTPA